MEFDAESMESKVGALSFDGREDVFDLVRIAIAFANTANTNPLTGCEEFPVLINVGGVRFGRIALENGHDVNVCEIEQASVAIDSDFFGDLRW